MEDQGSYSMQNRHGLECLVYFGGQSRADTEICNNSNVIARGKSCVCN
jgi:hypothetical protein